MKRVLYIAVLLLTLACRTEDGGVITSTTTGVTEPYLGDIGGVYLLNEGNMGSNKATLDYFDITTGEYHKNIFAEQNPTVAMELGDVGNDLQIYGDRLYAVINCSNLVEVMSLEDATHIGTISIPNCRYIVFEGDYAYVTSYQGDSESEGCGYIYKVEVETLSVVDKCKVGYQPEQMVIVGEKLYVANSVMYDSSNAPSYDNRVMVLDLDSFSVTTNIEVANNLHQMVLDCDGQIWVSSRGNYYDESSKIFVIDPTTSSVTAEVDVACSAMAIGGEYLYIISSEYSYLTLDYTTTWAKIHTPSQFVASTDIITDGSQSAISMPYSIAINPETEDIYITDAKSFTVSGTLYCYDSDGVQRWSATTGDIPSKMVFVERE